MKFIRIVGLLFLTLVIKICIGAVFSYVGVDELEMKGKIVDTLIEANIIIILVVPIYEEFLYRLNLRFDDKHIFSFPILISYDFLFNHNSRVLGVTDEFTFLKVAILVSIIGFLLIF